MHIFELSDILPPGASPHLLNGWTADSGVNDTCPFQEALKIMVYSGSSKC